MSLHTDRPNTHRRLCRSGSRSPANAVIWRPKRTSRSDGAAAATDPYKHLATELVGDFA